MARDEHVSDGTITDAALESVRGRIGQEFKIRRAPNLQEATRDAIRHWADALGDRDPKWTDPEYAKSTRFGGLTAPPSIIYAVDTTSLGDRTGLPGVHSFFSGADHEWYLPIKHNDELNLRVVLAGLDEKSSKFGGRMFKQISECSLTNQYGELVARSWPWGMRVERKASKSRGKYSALELAHYEPSDIAAISEQYSEEHTHIRGATPRYWEDVAVGDSVGPIIRGPWTPTISINFIHGAGGMFMMSHSEWYEYLRRHPKAGVPNELGIPEGPVRVHWDSDYARKVGVPAAYDYGPERIGWLTTLCTYWCGDDGWLSRLHVQINRFNLVGDLTTVEGVITGKGHDGDVHFVDLDIWARDQRGVDTAAGNARIILPVRTESAK